MTDNRLTFGPHVEYFKGKIIRKLKMMVKFRPIKKKETSLILYKVLVVSLFDYADIDYDCLGDKDMYTLQKLQNGALWIILQKGKWEPTSNMHQELSLNRLADRCHKHTIEHMYVSNNMVPKSTANMHEKVPVNNRNTRYSTQDNFIIPNLHLETAR